MNDKLKNILAKIFEVKPSEITPELTKEDVSSWDSLKQMDLVTCLEDEFEITFDMLEIVSLTSVQTIIDVLNKKEINLEN